MRSDIESIKTTYVSMMKGNDFQLILLPNEEIDFCDHEKLCKFIQTQISPIIVNELIQQYSFINNSLLDSIIDYYIELVCQ